MLLRCEGAFQGLLKDQLELKQIRLKDGRPRFTIKTIEDQLSFDKVYQSGQGTIPIGVSWMRCAEHMECGTNSTFAVLFSYVI